MRNFKIKCFGFQLPYKIQETERTMNLLEREYPECKTKKEMDETIQNEYLKRKIFTEYRGDMEDNERDKFNEFDNYITNKV